MTKTEAFKMLYEYRSPPGAVEAYEALEQELVAANARIAELEKTIRAFAE